MLTTKMLRRIAHRRLPSELIDMVIDFLHDDRNALRNCSISCQAMLSSCQVHLFQEICTAHTSSKGYKTDNLEHLNQLLQDSPHWPLHQGSVRTH
ncbi:hypothetical protein OBBRIDRAFT_401087 [Obba rivulosa]|uniref:F-box domain-containing protein n=1 Tax=Obba rivulosa TaxID=1052685 RepID=A0A8E2AHB7_9APHY|nr:hypothetical protein OBBRIDRAFT_401087 [Obba rivulosa]